MRPFDARRGPVSMVLVSLIVLLGACGDSEDSTDTTSPVVAPSSATTATTTPPTSTTTTAAPATTTTEAQTDPSSMLALSEAFVDAFYSYDAVALEATLSKAESSIPVIVWYQGWAEGGNYQIVDRTPCEVTGQTSVACSITVKDDFIQALSLDFNVTDTFLIVIRDGEIQQVESESDDPELVFDAFAWMQEQGDYEDLGDTLCGGFRDGGPTPEECARAIVQGFKDFAASDEFPAP